MKEFPILEGVLCGIGVSFEQLSSEAESIVLFGSRAANAHRNSSDWDLLCVGYGTTRKTVIADLIWIKPSLVPTREWRTSELAGHAAAFGVPLCGDTGWLTTVEASDDAAERKALRLFRRIQLLSQNWEKLTPCFQKKHWRLVANDIARLGALASHKPVPATPILQKGLDVSALCDIASKQVENGLISPRIRDQFIELSMSLSFVP